MDAIAGYCERCGRRFGLLPPQPGASDLDLEVVKSSFRYCVLCSQFVGRGCCWNADAVACTTCVPLGTSGATLLLGSHPTAQDREAMVRVAMSELTAAAGALAEVAHAIEPGQPARRRDARGAWDAAWWATAWLVVRAESSRDAASKLLWTRRAKDSHPDLTAWFKRDLAVYEAELHTVGSRLVESGRRIQALEAGPDSHQVESAAWRRALLPMIAAVVLALVAVGIGTGAIDRLVPGIRDGGPTSGGAQATASERGAVLGGDPAGPSAPPATPTSGTAPGDTPGNTAAPRDVPGATPEPGDVPGATPDAVLAIVEFDTMRMGALEEGSGITALAGQPEVVSFPSPFDRSVRLAGDESSGFCLSTDIEPGAPVDLTIDLYLEATPTGSLDVVLADADGHALLSVPLTLLADQPLERWYRASISWPGADAAELELRDVADGRIIRSESLDASAAPAGDAGAVCVSVVGTTPEGSILLDNITVEG